MSVGSVTQSALRGLQTADMAVQAIANNLASPQTASPAAAADDNSVGGTGPYDPGADQDMVALFQMAMRYQIDQILRTRLPVHAQLTALPRPE